MTVPNLCGFFIQDRITVSFDLSSPTSKVSHSVVYALNLAAIFTESGHRTCTTTLAIPTLGGHYSSHLNLIVGFNLPTDVVLGVDWVLPCQPAFNEDHTTLQQPDPFSLNSLPSPHNWYPIACVSIAFSPFHTFSHFN
jgi:hypothetical protein